MFGAIHAGKPDQSLLAYQYLQMLPNLARGDANKVWIVPSELNDALKGLGKAAGDLLSGGGAPAAVDVGEFKAPEKVDVFAEIEQQKIEAEGEAGRAVEQAIAEAQQMEQGRAARRASINAPAQLDAAPQPATEPPADALGADAGASGPTQPDFEPATLPDAPPGQAAESPLHQQPEQ